MKADKIAPGMVLKLKPERQEAYGMESPLVEVATVRPDPNGYKRFYVFSVDDYQYPVSDFKREGAMTSGQRIKEARTRLGMSQTQFAKALGLSRKQTVSNWEHGVKEPKPYVWLAIKQLQSKR